ncbi:hypothetical protein MLD38_039101 [Melastoma candidum]|uniref:Uncharacterized protein n=1 Tax=Melastoma candidum TaxID=119954 RepID=A0ACB9L3D7_9MYRT|nr:hypothetical protein MLD38_039101 [Melastoma candidum]
MDLLIAAAFTLYFLWLVFQALTYLTNSNTGSKSKDGAAAPTLPPGPKPLPIIGNLLSLGSLPHRSLSEISSSYGPIIKVSLGSVTTVIISSPELAKEIYHAHDASFPLRYIPDAVTPFDQDKYALPWMPISPLWKSLRRVCTQHLFSVRKLDSTQYLRRTCLEILLEQVTECCRDGVAVNLGEAAFGTSLNLMTNSMFSINASEIGNRGKRGCEGSVKEFKEIVWSILEEAGKPNVSDFFPVLKRFDLQGARRRMTRNFGRMLQVIEGLIEKRLDERAKNGEKRENTNSDLLDTLLDICEEKTEAMQVFHIKHFFLDLFIAGTDTTSSTVEWAMAELLHNPEKLARSQDELHRIVGNGKPIEESDFCRLPYLNAIVKETFRLHPAAPLLMPRKCSDDTLIGGYTVPRDSQVFVNVWAIGRDKDVWGDDATEFMPERFLGSSIDLKGQYPELSPFGGGRRICPGLPLAVRMAHLMLGSLLNNFGWKIADGVAAEEMNMDEKFGITLQKAQPLRAVPLRITETSGREN